MGKAGVLLLKRLAGIINKSIKRQLLTYFVTVAITSALLISIYNYSTSYRVLKENMVKTNSAYVQHLMELVDKDLVNIDLLTQGLLMNQELLKVLRKSPPYVKQYGEAELGLINEVGQQFKYNPIASYIVSFLIIGENGAFVDAGYNKGHFHMEEIKHKDWFMSNTSTHKNIFFPPVKNEKMLLEAEYYIPVIRHINDVFLRKKTGEIVVLFNNKLFNDLMGSAVEGEEMYLVDDSGKILAGTKAANYGRNIGELKLLKGLDLRRDSEYIDTTDKKNIIVYKRSTGTGWLLLKIIPIRKLSEQAANAAVSTLIMLSVTVIFAYLMSLYLTENFSRPLKKIMESVKEVAAGNFNHAVEVTGEHEIGKLGANINYMASEIKKYISELEIEHQERTKAEIRMLQNQINPHFLYNTLSSIRYMASLQKAEGIEEMACSLGRLLKSAMGNVNEKIPLEEELGLIEDYMKIQNIRYRGKIQYFCEVKDPALLRLPIIKFTLQPFVENAIFHGIEPKRGRGEIKMEITRSKDIVQIAILDNGMGMSQEKIKNLLNIEVKDFSGRGQRGIGVKNVIQRFHLIYGEGFKVSIDSVENRYTRVLLEFPAENTQDKEEGT